MRSKILNKTRQDRLSVFSNCFFSSLLSVSLIQAGDAFAQSQVNLDNLTGDKVVNVDAAADSKLDLDGGFTLLDSVDSKKSNQIRPTAGAVSGNKNLDKEARDLQEAERAILARSKEAVKEVPKNGVENAIITEAVVKPIDKPAIEPARAAVNIAKIAPVKPILKSEHPAPDRSAEVVQLQKDLGLARQKIADLSSDLDKTRARLMTAETEVDRLSNLLEGQDRSAARFTPGANRQEASRPAERSGLTRSPASSLSGSGIPSSGIAPASAPQVGAGGELSIVTVTVDKAVVRTAASRDSSPIMALNRGTRLVVESRSGEWFRVLTPSGVRAWITADAIAAGQSAGVSRDTAKAVAADAFGSDGF